MRYTAKHRFADVGPRKIRLFADLIRGKNVDDALQLLRFYPNRGAKLLMAVVEAGTATPTTSNTRTRTASSPVPRGRADVQTDSAARGTAFRIMRRMAHIVVSLSDPEDLEPVGAGGRRRSPGDARPERRSPATVGGTTTPVLTTTATDTGTGRRRRPRRCPRASRRAASDRPDPARPGDDMGPNQSSSHSTKATH